MSSVAGVNFWDNLWTSATHESAPTRCRETTGCTSLRRCRLGLLGAGRLDYLPGLQTRGADIYPFRNSVYQRPDSLQVRVPPPFSQVVGVGNIMSKSRFLAANLTCFCHIGPRFVLSNLLSPNKIYTTYFGRGKKYLTNPTPYTAEVSGRVA
jgi:hypothetical protein